MIYEVLRWEEKAILDSAKEIGLDFTPIHLHTTFFCVSNDSFENPFCKTLSQAPIALQRSISHANVLSSTLALEAMGIRVVNNSISTAISMNKLWTLTILSRNSIPIPRTIIAYSEEVCYNAARFLEYPVVVKPIDGSWGRLIAMARDDEELRAIIEHRSYLPNPVMRVHMIQEFVKKPNRDIRVFVVGDEVPAAIYRVSNHWITNTARGGKAVPARVDEELKELALRVAKLIGVEIAGIDVFEDRNRGYIVNEVNAVPEFKNTVMVTGVKIHLKIVEYLKNQLKK
jgi:[lysine-biosynthesis-protein LysW]--L-2-aminoadipate ligase